MTPHFYNHPLFIVNEPMLTSGYTKDLVYGQLGIFYNSTRSAVDGSLKGNQPVILATGSYHTKDKLSDYNQGLKQSIKTVAFLPTDIISFRKSPIQTAVAEEVVMGYDGTNPTETLEFFCGKHYQFQIRVWGEDVNNIMLHPIVRTISLDTECCDEECTSGCTPFQLGTDFYTKQLVEKINNDVELKKFVKAEAILSGLTPKSTTYTKWSLTVADTGDITALASIGADYNSVAAIDPVRESRSGIYSTYAMYLLTSAGTPSAYTPTAPLSLEVCGTCPSGYTTVAATDVYMVVRPLSGSTDLTTANAQDTYADLVGTDYGVSTDSKKTFLFNNGASAGVKIVVAAGTSVTAVKSDVVTKIGSTQAICTPPAGSSVAWVNEGSYYKNTKTIYITVDSGCDPAVTSSSMLSDLQAYYASVSNISDIAVETSGSCSVKFSATQYSNELLEEGCLTQPEGTFSMMLPYNGIPWEEAPVATGSTTVYGGVRLTAAFQGLEEFECSFRPTDFYTAKPLHLEIQQVFNSGNPCEVPYKSVKRIPGQMATQTGHWLVREFIAKQGYNAYSDFLHDVRAREVMDGIWFTQLDKKKSYTMYYLKVKAYRDYQNLGGGMSPEFFEWGIALEEGVDTAAFEASIMPTLTKFGVDMVIES